MSDIFSIWENEPDIPVCIVLKSTYGLSMVRSFISPQLV